MKTLKLTVLILTMLIINSCGKDKDKNLYSPKRFYDCLLWIRFQDTQGNDLANGIDWSQEENQAAINKNKELYTLEIVYPEVYMDPVWTHYHSGGAYIPSHSIGYKLNISIDKNNSYYLSFHPQTSVKRSFDKELPLAEKIIYKLKCPYIFGDDSVYEIVTWWEIEKETLAICYRLEFDGKEFPIEKLYFATIVLDR